MNRRRSYKLNFSANCKCLMHEQWKTNVGSDKGINISTNKKFISRRIKKMRDDGLLSMNSNYLCKPCYDVFSKKNFSEESSTLHENKHENADNGTTKNNNLDAILLSERLVDLISVLENHTQHELSEARVEKELWCKLMELIAKKIVRDGVYRDGMELCRCYKDN